MTQTRRRVCYHPLTADAMGCESKGKAVEERICGEAICPRLPEWSAWGPWESCSSPCAEDGEGVSLRRRICLDDMKHELSCVTSPPEGPTVQRAKCVMDTRCYAASFSPWGEWGQCDMTCNPRDGSSLGSQFRTRQCTGLSCGSLDESVTKQFR